MNDQAIEICFDIPLYTKLPKYTKHQNVMQASTFHGNYHLFAKKDLSHHPRIEKERKGEQFWPGLFSDAHKISRPPPQKLSLRAVAVNKVADFIASHMSAKCTAMIGLIKALIDFPVYCVYHNVDQSEKKV